MKTKLIPPQEIFVARRFALVKRVRAISENSIVILNTAPEVARNRDNEYAYRHDSDFYYLTGFTEPEAFLVIQTIGDKTTTHLFCRPKDLEREIWDGIRLGPEAAPEELGIDYAYSIADLDTKMPELMTGFDQVFTRNHTNELMDEYLRKWTGELAKKSRLGISKPSVFQDVECLIHDMRLFKDESEIATMQQAAWISSQAHLAAMKRSKPGLKEYHLEAEILYTFRNHGSESVAYNSIVATGENACVLHYRAADSILKDGDLCLIDAGCELLGYASDITRTFPVNGKFSPAQAQAYNLVLAAQEAAIAKCKVGESFQAPHDAALEVLTKGLFEMGILNQQQHGSIESAIENKAYQPYYMHRTSHWLGMDVHDVGSYRELNDPNKAWRTLQPNMILTVEPGLYFRPSKEIPKEYWNIGIRIEDDVVITTGEPLILSRDVPVTVSEIEAWMAQSS
ncbi:aminopeptidase P N-terminal domain-containing protein [Polynucleobacter rarus]|uniref:aminopeptidase P N-terminal domain-containing protein n=1 Tax=Polynucleobacter rarus TaxID=556055 RepID=UPI000D3E4018|nr:aminopeptidase P N-terminal domain-containing protein [Polynucleobacter rarus]